MRIFIFVILTCTLSMCKSKSTIPSDQLLGFFVVLENGSSPKELKKDISYELLGFEEDKIITNQWMLNFDENVKKAKQIKTALLNHPIVLSVLTKDEYEKMKLEPRQLRKNTSQRQRKATKQ